MKGMVKGCGLLLVLVALIAIGTAKGPYGVPTSFCSGWQCTAAYSAPAPSAAASAAAYGPGAAASAQAGTLPAVPSQPLVKHEMAYPHDTSSTSLEFVDVYTSTEPFVQSSLRTIIDVAAAAYPRYVQGMQFYAQPEQNTLVYPERWNRMLPNLDFSSADALLNSLVNGQKYVAQATFTDEFGNQVVLVETATAVIDGGLNSAFTVWGYLFSPDGSRTELPPVEVRRNRLGQMVYFEAGPSTL
jgi:hypothetical protein